MEEALKQHNIDQEKLKLIIDSDYIRYAAGFASEKRKIKVVHQTTGDEYIFSNRTEFYGRGKAKDKGWIAEQNAERDSPLLASEFDIYDIQIPEPIENALNTAKRMFEGILETFETRNYIAYYGKGDSFRVDRSTIIQYKGNREGTLRPIRIEEITEYLVKKFGMIPCIGLEADDWCNIEGQKPNTVVTSIDKDTGGCPVLWYNPNKPEDGIVNGRQFGKIWVEEKSKGNKEVRGYGRKFFYYQVAYGDDVDNYRANSATDKEWGKLGAFDILEGCKNDRESLQALVNIYKTLYPTPHKIVGWKGETITIDWLYVMQENWDMAHMWRNPDSDYIDVKQVLDKLKVEY